MLELTRLTPAVSSYYLYLYLYRLFIYRPRGQGPRDMIAGRESRDQKKNSAAPPATILRPSSLPRR
jgi:hypothetical protein